MRQRAKEAVGVVPIVHPVAWACDCRVGHEVAAALGIARREGTLHAAGCTAFYRAAEEALILRSQADKIASLGCAPNCGLIPGHSGGCIP